MALILDIATKLGWNAANALVGIERTNFALILHMMAYQNDAVWVNLHT